VRFGETKRRT